MHHGEAARHHRCVQRDRWLPPIDEIIEAAPDRDVPVLVDAAQVGAHRPLPATADYVVWSGHRMYAPFGAGILLGPHRSFTNGDPFLAGGGSVDLVDLDEVARTDPPEREEAGSPNVIGAVGLHAAIGELRQIAWEAIAITTGTCPRDCATAWPPSTGSRCSAPSSPSTRCRWPRSPSPGCITPSRL